MGQRTGTPTPQGRLRGCAVGRAAGGQARARWTLRALIRQEMRLRAGILLLFLLECRKSHYMWRYPMPPPAPSETPHPLLPDLQRLEAGFQFPAGDWSQFSSVQSLSRVRLFATPWTAARQASLSTTSSRRLPRPPQREHQIPTTSPPGTRGQ